jgi:hypothetical protein
MWNFCDDQGVHPASAKRLKMEVFPADSFTPEQIEEWIDELREARLLTEYTAEGEEYWAVTGWKHQKIEKPSAKYPPPPARKPSTADAQESPNGRRTVADDQPAEGKGVDVEKESSSARETVSHENIEAEFEAWYQAFPCHRGRGHAWKAYKTARKKTDAATLLAGAKRYAADPSRKPDFTAYPSSWLNGERWLDAGTKSAQKTAAVAVGSPEWEQAQRKLMGDAA